MNLADQCVDILDASRFLLSNTKPSEWAEANRVMSSEVTSFPGPFRFDRTPYCREIVDCLSQDHPARLIAVMKGAQIGFALDCDTPIITTQGWVKMIDLKVNDFVYTEKGTPTRVTRVSEIMTGRKCYIVKFSDGSEIKCDADHLWTVKDLKGIERVLTTELIKPKVIKFKKSGKHRSRYSIDNTKPVLFPEKELPIDPYLLGLWLGDGHKNANYITATIEDAKEYQDILHAKGILTKIRGTKDNHTNCVLAIVNSMTPSKGGFNFHGNKHIPEIYKTASYSQRLELVQGLIDTDGHVMKDSKVEFYSINKDFIEDVKELISSLGYKVTIRLRKNENTYTKIHPTRRYKMKPIYVLNFMGTFEVPVAKLKRKKERLRSLLVIRKEVTKRFIVSIEECESVPVKCISVDSEKKLYLAGKSFIPTHNSVNVIENGIGWIISQNPGNILFLSGHQDLVEEAMDKKVDQMIDSCGLRPLIRPNVIKKKNQRTGDTSKAKEFPGGSLIAGSASNHKLLRQRSVQYGFIDDFDSAKKSSKESGNTRTLIQQRFAAYYDKMKLFFISTPELKQTSNIEPVYLLGDQRKYFIPCPCCGEYIDLHWSVTLSSQMGGERAGIVWELDKNGKLIEESVKYRCQKCGDLFDDSKKGDLIRVGEWRPTAEPSEPGYYSYHISSLYAPPGMFDWTYYVRQYLEANPVNGKQKEDLQKTFMNLCLGLPYEQSGKVNEADTIQRNTRDYEIDIIPDLLSKKDNSRGIVMLTCAADLNGKLEDARLDYEITAWAKNGSSYSVRHGSIGTFIPHENRNKPKADRKKWTYDINGNSVWPEFEKILAKEFVTDGGNKMKVMLTGIDTGYHTEYAYAFIDRTKFRVIGLKGNKEEQYRKFGIDMPHFKMAKERSKLYLLDINFIKDRVSSNMDLKWSPGVDGAQPEGFMNYPTPSNGMYQFRNYFEHFQSEHRVLESKDNTPIAARWVKVNSSAQNHHWDCYVYNYALKDIWADMVLKSNKPVIKGGWAEFVKLGEMMKVF